jgi:prepilin-type N-terminal cleavage/methylation domain-containing protein
MKKLQKGFTLIELLVVISIIGILLGIVGPKVFDLLTSSKKTKLASSFSAWSSQIAQYKSHYGYYPPFLFDEEEGMAITIDTNELQDSFFASLKGRIKNESGGWESLSDSLSIQNPESREFHSFNESEFNEEGNIFGFGNLKILVDQDGDGAILLNDELVQEILDSLSLDYSSDQIDEVERDIFSVVNQPIIFFLLSDSKEDLNNVFSWNVEKYFD